MEHYDHKSVEKKWQSRWEADSLYKTVEGNNNVYILDMFPYPSGDGLHVGHVESYTATDIYARYLRMCGKNVLHPMGWDAFGLPAENFAIKTGVHPEETTKKASDNFRRQIKSIGLSYDWDREIDTHSPEYYKWTQWLFLQLYNEKLAYKKKAKVNWCESCMTVLANEQVVMGACERCGGVVIQKDLEQWFFRITKYAEALHADLESVDWPESTVANQRNWIGKSEGALIEFAIKGHEEKISVFTTRPDTLFGATYMVIAPEHPLLDTLADSIVNMQDVTTYTTTAQNKTDIERTAEGREKTGIVLEGVSAMNPATNEEIPIYVADYVLSHYGTGAIMAVPAHDERDYEFAKMFNLDIVQVISGGDNNSNAYIGEGVLVNSKAFNGMSSREARVEITEAVGGTLQTTYKLRDWLVSRQRYWGAPIPIVYDPDDNPVPVPEEHLPWLLPTDVEFKPTGISPLAESKELQERVTKIFGEGYRPEFDTMDTFVCSSWYYLRYSDPHNDKEFASKKALDTWLPVNMYLGGAEHTVLHLLYARFITKVLHSLGYVSFHEPFTSLRHQGMILASDGRKMSKSLGNVINPDDVISQVGADTLRVYEMFMGPLDQAIAWNTDNMVGARRFLERVWKLFEKKVDIEDSKEVRALLHKTIQKVSDDISNLKFNTAISALMILCNMLETQKGISSTTLKTVAQLVAPFAPHFSEELWERMGETYSVHQSTWPVVDKALLVDEKVVIVIQVNGKVRATIEVQRGVEEQEILEFAKNDERVLKFIDSKTIAKTIYIKDKLLNIVV